MKLVLAMEKRIIRANLEEKRKKEITRKKVRKVVSWQSWEGGGQEGEEDAAGEEGEQERWARIAKEEEKAPGLVEEPKQVARKSVVEKAREKEGQRPAKGEAAEGAEAREVM